MTWRTRLFLLVAVVGGLACAPEQAPEIRHFSVTPSHATVWPSEVTLRWEVAGADHVWLEDPEDQIVESHGALQLTVTGESVFTLAASNEAGTVRQKVQVHDQRPRLDEVRGRVRWAGGGGLAAVVHMNGEAFPTEPDGTFRARGVLVPYTAVVTPEQGGRVQVFVGLTTSEPVFLFAPDERPRPYTAAAHVQVNANVEGEDADRSTTELYLVGADDVAAVIRPELTLEAMLSLDSSTSAFGFDLLAFRSTRGSSGREGTRYHEGIVVRDLNAEDGDLLAQTVTMRPLALSDVALDVDVPPYASNVAVNIRFSRPGRQELPGRTSFVTGSPVALQVPEVAGYEVAVDVSAGTSTPWSGCGGCKGFSRTATPPLDAAATTVSARLMDLPTAHPADGATISRSAEFQWALAEPAVCRVDIYADISGQGAAWTFFTREPRVIPAAHGMRFEPGEGLWELVCWGDHGSLDAVLGDERVLPPGYAAQGAYRLVALQPRSFFVER